MPRPDTAAASQQAADTAAERSARNNPDQREAARAAISSGTDSPLVEELAAAPSRSSSTQRVGNRFELDFETTTAAKVALGDILGIG